MNLEFIKKIMTKEKTSLPSHSNEERKKVRVENHFQKLG